MLNRIQLKGDAKAILRTAKVSPYLMGLLFLLLRAVMEFLDGYVSGNFIAYLNTLMPGIPIPEFLMHGDFKPIVIVFVSVMTWLLTSVLITGWSIYHLGIRRGETMGYSSLFDGFSFVGKLILTNLAVTALVSLGTALFVIPGIIISYMYRFAIYNLCEDPNMPVLQAMRMSAQQTRGYRMQLFVLDISFLGWQLLTIITGGIAAVWAMPYVEQTNVGAFQQLKRMSGIGVPNGPSAHEDAQSSYNPDR